MKKQDIMFKVGLGLQLLLIPITFLWHFSEEANYYNWVLVIGFAVVIGLFFWPQTLLGRLKRLHAIQLQLILVVIVLALSWVGYIYFHHFTRANCSPPVALTHGAGQSGVIYPDELGQRCDFSPSADQSVSTTFYSINWQGLFGRPWPMLLSPGIAPLSAGMLTIAFLGLPLANFYRYKLDSKRIQGIKKEDLFV